MRGERREEKIDEKSIRKGRGEQKIEEGKGMGEKRGKEERRLGRRWEGEKIDQKERRGQKRG